jgi:hypothetical protein
LYNAFYFHLDHFAKKFLLRSLRYQDRRKLRTEKISQINAVRSIFILIYGYNYNVFVLPEVYWRVCDADVATKYSIFDVDVTCTERYLSTYIISASSLPTELEKKKEKMLASNEPV